MWSKRKDEDRDLHSEKRYQFIREQVRPKKRELVFCFLKRLAAVIVFAGVFGGIAGGIIVTMQSHLVRTLPETEAVSTPAVEPPEETGIPAENKVKKFEEKALSLNDYQKLTKKLAAVGTGMDSALVGIQTKGNAKNWFSQNKTGRRVAYGLIFDSATGYYDVLTTSDIVQEQELVNVQLLDDTIIEGIILGSDEQLNLAVVRIKKKDIAPELRKQMTTAELVGGLGLSSGTNVIAIGSPNGILRSVVMGTITNDSVCASLVDGEVQLYSTDISYSSLGNGVVLDTDGRVAGVITTEFAEETGMTGMSFVKLSDITTRISLLQKRRKMPYLGIEGKTLSVIIAKAHHLEIGAYVTEVYSGTPAYKAGMRVADVITEIDGDAVSGMSDVYHNLMKHQSEDTVTYTVSRKSGNKKITKKLKVTLG